MTTAEEEQAFPAKRPKWAVVIALFCLFLLVRVVALDADPPPGLSWSAGIFTDEGIYAADARSVVLTGHWAPGDFHSAIITPLFHLVQLGVFRVFGVGLLQARSVSVACGLATLALFFAALQSVHGTRTALIGVTFLGLSVPFVLYNRLALLETPTLLVLVAAYFVWAKDGSKFLIGSLLGIAFVFKPLALLAAPAFIIAAWPRYRGILQIVVGLTSVLLAYGLVWYLPHRATLARMNHYYAFHQYLPHSGRGVAHDLMRGLWTGVADGILPYLAHHELLLSALAALSIVSMRVERKDDRLLTAWLLIPIIVFLFVSYTPSRYFVLFWPPLAALAACGVSGRSRFVCAGCISVFVALSVTQLAILWTHRAQTVLEDGENLPKLISRGTLVAGQFAPELCLSNRLMCLYVQPGLANDNASPKSDGSAAILVTQSPYWEQWRQSKSPFLSSRTPDHTMVIGSKFVVDVYLEKAWRRHED